MRLAVEVPAYCSYYFLCLSFQFSVYFVVSEMRVIWSFLAFPMVILIKKVFAFAKARETCPHILDEFFAFQNTVFLKKHFLKHYQTPDLFF